MREVSFLYHHLPERAKYKGSDRIGEASFFMTISAGQKQRLFRFHLAMTGFGLSFRAKGRISFLDHSLKALEK